jgi:hypothetical protein
MHGDPTETNLPIPRRPEYGLTAWLLTIGYISEEHSPDAMLTLRVQPAADEALVWAVRLTWGEYAEETDALPSLADALRLLWRQVSKMHHLFKTFDAAVRQPANYDADRWIDPVTQAALDRLLSLTRTAFAEDWLLLIIYQPTDNPQLRVQARLLAKNNTIHLGGRGASIADACRDLYLHLAPNAFKQEGTAPG